MPKEAAKKPALGPGARIVGDKIVATFPEPIKFGSAEKATRVYEFQLPKASLRTEVNLRKMASQLGFKGKLVHYGLVNAAFLTAANAFVEDLESLPGSDGFVDVVHAAGTLVYQHLLGEDLDLSSGSDSGELELPTPDVTRANGQITVKFPKPFAFSRGGEPKLEFSAPEPKSNQLALMRVMARADELGVLEGDGEFLAAALHWLGIDEVGLSQVPSDVLTKNTLMAVGIEVSRCLGGEPPKEPS